MATKENIKSDFETELKIKKPSLYHVILLNDDYTTMEFVVDIVVNVFYKTPAEATKIMMDVHTKGRGIVGTYPFDIAVSKQNKVEELARESNYPLKTVVEEA